MYDVTALGELLIDFAPAGAGALGSPLFEANPGGAVCNVLAMLSRLGRRTAFIGKVGGDMFGDSLRRDIRSAGIDDRGLISDPDARTTLAFVALAPDGDRSFSFFRNPGADMLLTAAEVDMGLVGDSRVFHFGTLSMTHPGVRAATLAAVEAARAAGALVSFDPNLRPPLWDSLEHARKEMRLGCTLCDVLKIADDELRFLTGEDALDRGAERLLRDTGLKLLFVTEGARGSRAFSRTARAAEPALPVKAIDTTGAGDTFMGCALDYVLEHGTELDGAALSALLRRANAAAGIVTTRRGALCAMPTAEEVAAAALGYADK